MGGRARRGASPRRARPLGAFVLAIGLAGSIARADSIDDAALPLGAGPSISSATATEPAREGEASWYGPQFHGRLTACGERFHQDGFTAAHRTLPFGTLLNVTNLDTGCSVMLRVNDRGPYHGNRILDCSRAAAEELGFIDDGVARIRWEIIDPASVAGAPVAGRGGGAWSASSGRAGRSGHSGAGASHVSVPLSEPPRPMNTEEVSW